MHFIAGLLEKQNLFSPLLKKSLKKFNVETGPNEEIVSPKSDSDDEEDQMGAQLEALLTASTGFDESSDGISAQNLNESLESLDESVIRQSNQLSLAQKHRKIDNQVKLTSTHKQVVEADSTQSLTESPSPRSQQLIPSLKNSPGPPISSNFIVPRTSPLVKSQPNRLLTESKVPTKKESLPVVKEKVVDELKPCVITPVHKPNPVREFKRREVVRTPKVVQKIPAYLPPVEIEKRAINEVMSALDREIFAYIRPPMSPIRDWSVIPLLEVKFKFI